MMPMKVTSAILVEVYATADCNVYLLVYCSLLSKSEMKNIIVARRKKGCFEEVQTRLLVDVTHYEALKQVEECHH